MLKNQDVVATIAVKNAESARKFYEGVLGLESTGHEMKNVLSYKSGSGKLIVYESQFAGTNQATAVTWVVGDEIESIVSALKSKGAKFEHYNFPGMKLEGDIHVMGKIKNAWLKDPDGNILSIVNGS